MISSQQEADIMKSQYEHYVWAEDDTGEKYVCVFDDDEEHDHKYEDLTEEEKTHCKPVEFPWN